MLEEANIKLASVATDIRGVSARAMLWAIVRGPAEAGALAELARGRLREKRGSLEKALYGPVKGYHRFLLAEQLAHLEYLELISPMRMAEARSDSFLRAPTT